MGLFKPVVFYKPIVTAVGPGPGPTYYTTYDPYSGSIQLAIPGAEFASLGMSNWYDDISDEVRGTGTSYTANPTGSASQFVEYTTSTQWTDYSSSMYTMDDGSWGAIPTADFSIGTQPFVLEGWLYMDERFTKPPFWKVGLRDSSYNISLEMGFPGTGTTDWKSRIMINGSQFFSTPTNIAFNLNQWYHIAWVRNTGGTLSTYIDGTKYSNGSSTNSVGTGGTTRIMRGENVTNDGTAGAWQDFRFYVGTDKGYSTTTINTPYQMVSTVPQDSDAVSFIRTAGLTDTTECNAINELVNDLKDAGIWDKMIAIYPFVGGTSNSTKYNLKNTGAFNITWNTGFTFSSDGVKNNGANSSTTNINISTNMSQNDSSISIYVGSNTAAEDKLDIGAVSGGNGIQIATRNVANQYGGKMYDNVNDNYANTNSQGFYQFSRDNSSSYYAQRNGVRNTTTRASQSPPSVVLAIGGLPNAAYATKQYRFASAGQALTTTEMDDFYTAVQKFQTTLGRNV